MSPLQDLFDLLHQVEDKEDTWAAGGINLAEPSEAASGSEDQSKGVNCLLDDTAGRSLPFKQEENASLQAMLTRLTEDTVVLATVLVMEWAADGLRTFTKLEVDTVHDPPVDEDTWAAGEINHDEQLEVASGSEDQSKSVKTLPDDTIGGSLLSKLEENASLQAMLMQLTENMVVPATVIVMEWAVVGLKTFTKLEVEDNLDRET